jgi:predicted ArsR family transcriptional regulator
MEGLTIDEMAEILSVKRRAIETRLKRLGIEPLTKSAVYDKSALEAIRDMPGKGRPRKKAAADTEKPKKS